MNLFEVATWVILGTLAAGVVHAHAIAPTPLPKAPSTEKEVDPTRWRHDGTQPTIDRLGNKRPAADFSNDVSGATIESIALATEY